MGADGVAGAAAAASGAGPGPNDHRAGVVTDAKTREKLPFVSVAVPQSTLGTNTDEQGRFTLQVPTQYTTLIFSYLGYRQVTRTFAPGAPVELSVQLAPSAAQLNEVVIQGTKPPRYKNKDNPAVELIRQIIEHRAENQPESYPYVEYEKYEKMAFSFSNLSEKFKNRKIFRNYQFLFKQQDSAAVGGEHPTGVPGGKARAGVLSQGPARAQDRGAGQQAGAVRQAIY
ncbi:MAG: carboxypeptidase-like regulatory domain-containing protein [Hymenobacter sp.]